MSNHYHRLVETPDGNLSTGMRQLSGSYTQHFNAYASGGYTLTEIGEYFGLHYSRISRIRAKAKGKT